VIGHNGQDMSNEFGHKTAPNQPLIYQLRIEGHLEDQWADSFGGMSLSREENGDTLLTGKVVDQAMLHGLLKKVRDLGLSLVSINRVELDQSDVAESER
jgi:hypothetical protein